MREIHRVVRRGGLIVIEDSAQIIESAEIATALREFPREFHEPSSWLKSFKQGGIAHMTTAHVRQGATSGNATE